MTRLWARLFEYVYFVEFANKIQMNSRVSTFKVPIQKKKEYADSKHFYVAIMTSQKWYMYTIDRNFWCV